MVSKKLKSKGKVASKKLAKLASKKLGLGEGVEEELLTAIRAQVCFSLPFTVRFYG